MARAVDESTERLDARVAVAAAAPTPVVVWLVDVLQRELHASRVHAVADAVFLERGLERRARERQSRLGHFTRLMTCQP